MFEHFAAPLTIVKKEWVEASRNGFFIALTGFLSIAGIISLTTGAIALSTDVATYISAKELLLALGKSLDGIASPEFYPLKLLRGAIEQIEIVGAVIGILIGYRSGSSERNNQTLTLVITRPTTTVQFLLGKLLAGYSIITATLFTVFTALTAVLVTTSGIGLGIDDIVRITLVWALGSIYISIFFTVSLFLVLTFKRPSSALLTSFALWLLVVLVAPQVGDTLDPDNQVAGGVFKQLHIPKAEQERIKRGYANFELFRNGIEVSSVTKHFERASFAILGIKDSYTGTPLSLILKEKSGDILLIFLTFLSTSLITLSRKFNFQVLTKEA